MPPSPSRIAEDLRGQVTGEVIDSEITRRLYSTDGSLYEIVPAAVVRPRVTADVAALVRYASEEGITVHARGAGTGLAGGALGEGIVVDFSRYMRRFVEDSGETVVVQPGLVHADLNRRLAASGRVFAPDPSRTEATTLGSVAAIDASGSRRPIYGTARDHIVGLSVVLSDGRLLRIGGEEAEQNLALRTLNASLARTLREGEPVLREHLSRGRLGGSGYALDRAFDGDRVDLLQLLLGSEGTLGLITELTLRTSPTPEAVSGALFTFGSLEAAAQAALAIGPSGVASCDLLDRRRLALAREAEPRYEDLFSGAAEAVLFAEFFGANEDEARGRAQEVIEAVRKETSVSVGAIPIETPDDLELLQQLARRSTATIHTVKGVRRPVPGVEDIIVPPAALPQFFLRLQELLKHRQVTASVFCHALHGQVHLRPLLDLTSPAELRKLETLASELYDTVWLLGGAMSGCHGDGLSRTPFASRQHGPLVNVFREVKAVFDPGGILNPGKVVPSPGARMTHTTRGLTPLSGSQPVELRLAWDANEAAEASRLCNGCGDCRDQSEAVRMCPIFRFTPREEATPRSKANLLRGVLTGALSSEALLQDEAKRVADLCVNCHQCRLECPAKVDIPKMMLEAKAAYVDTNGLPMDAWFSMRIDTFARNLALAPRTANRLMSNRYFRWALERTIGLAAGRRLPKLAHKPYRRDAASRRLHRRREHAGGSVLYFVDTYANYFDTQLATAFERILDHHEIALFVPNEPMQSGMAMVSQGALEPARRVAERNVSVLAEAVRRGDTIVATEPTAVLALKHEYRNLLPDDEDAAVVAENTFEACHYLWRHHLDSKLRLDLDPLPHRVAYHVPCHVRALGEGVPTENLLRLIPSLQTTRLDKGCSGMAGTYGLLRKNYRSSLRAGLPMLSELRTGEFHIGTTECGACRTQMEQNAPIPTIHPLKLLAASYGLMPDVMEQLQSLTISARRSSSGEC